MAQDQDLRIEPDHAFIKHLARNGGATAKRCFQCATCSVVCGLSPADKPFPRKEMLWAQWGLKDRLLTDPDVWLCHQCNDCTARCPRDARPGDVLAAVRRAAIAEYAFPRWLGRLTGDPRALPLLLAIPFVVVAIALSAAGTFFAPSVLEGTIEFAKLAPHSLIEPLYIGISALVALAFVIGGVRFWRALDRRHGRQRNGSLIAAIWEIVAHRRFRECTAERSRHFSHLLVFVGFVALAATAGLAAIAQKVFDVYPPLPLGHPIKILGNIGAAMVGIGGAILVWRRATGHDGSGRSTYFDWLFVLVLYSVALTGILCEIVRLSGSPAAYTIYYVHLSLVMFLLGYAPYTKFAHFWYRALSMVYAEARSPFASRSAAAVARTDAGGEQPSASEQKAA
ncbi:MAG: quinone-interacting membrane-bound oxidoreductase complex subunit QmoC [Pseudomonadota bacterium]